MIRARASDLLTRFDGDVSGLGIPDPAGPGRVVSPTALEAWARCPHAYFVQRLLRVEPAGAPEELIEISPLESGSLIHEVLDRFFTGQSLKAAVPGPGQRWTAAQRAELGRIAVEVASEFEARGVTGHPVLWRRELGRICADLQVLLDDDDRLRAGQGRVQVRSELVFGMAGRPAVPFRLPDGRQMRFRGSADRVDRAGDALVVVDYKTGSARAFQTISETDPTPGGTKLQLPVYAHAARAGLGLPDGCRVGRVLVPAQGPRQADSRAAHPRGGPGVQRGGRGHRGRDRRRAVPAPAARRRQLGRFHRVPVLRSRRPGGQRAAGSAGAVSAATRGWPATSP